MINFSEKDKEYIDSNKGTCSTRGFSEVLSTIEKKFGKEKKEELKRAMEELGYDVSFEGKKPKVALLSSLIALLVATKYFFNLDESGVKEIGKESVKFSFLLRFASRLLVSIDMICNNANGCWHRYYDSGEFIVIESNKEKKRIVGEVRAFASHPLYCRYIEGYFEQIIFFVTGKKVVCREEECIFKGGNVHRYVITWE